MAVNRRVFLRKLKDLIQRHIDPDVAGNGDMMYRVPDFGGGYTVYIFNTEGMCVRSYWSMDP
jgi:hypothetical protein